MAARGGKNANDETNAMFEQQNNDALSGLAGQVNMIKQVRPQCVAGNTDNHLSISRAQITIDLHSETKDQNVYLDGMVS
jgi:hypothetical protein